MKRIVCLLLALMLATLTLAGCDRRSETAVNPDASPEATPLGGLTGAVEQQSAMDAEGEIAPEEEIPELHAPSDAEEPPEDEGNAEQPVAPDEPIDGETTPEPAQEDAPEGANATATPDPDDESPFATPTPQPNTAITDYSEVSAEGLGFRFSYPSDWTNIPGRYTVCYVQPLENGTVYPARVAVTMKRLPHKTEGMDEAKTELADYVRTLMAQYDEDTFRVETKLDEETRFMGKSALSTTYLAYDGAQEIKGYTIITYFERYLFVFHFLCAYEDYDSFYSAMCYMRDSVQADTSVAPN